MEIKLIVRLPIAVLLCQLLEVKRAVKLPIKALACHLLEVNVIVKLPIAVWKGQTQWKLAVQTDEARFSIRPSKTICGYIVLFVLGSKLD